MKGVSKRQQEIITFIDQYIEKNQFSPTFREIQDHFGFSSLGTVYQHVEALKKKGLVTAEKRGRRTLSLTDISSKNESGGGFKIPFIGQITVGFPIKTFSKTQTLSIPSFLVHSPEKTYILKAKGDALAEEQIADGDLLIVEARQEVNAGETVIALINHHDTIIKKYYPEGQYARLEGNNPNQQPLILKHENIQIQGVLIGLLRVY